MNLRLIPSNTKYHNLLLSHTPRFMSQNAYLRFRRTHYLQLMDRHRINKGNGGEQIKNKFLSFSPQENYTDRATVACRRSKSQLLRIDRVAWSGQRIPTAVNLGFLDRNCGRIRWKYEQENRDHSVWCYLFTVYLHNVYHRNVFNTTKNIVMTQSNNPYEAYEILYQNDKRWVISISHKHIKSERNSNKCI
jgi:hypothetical protein